MISKKFVVGALILTGALASGLAQARDNVQWSVTIGAPIGVPIYSQPYPVYSQPYPVYSQPAPIVVQRPYFQGRPYVAAYGDRDRDGIPNRFDRVYNPRWDRDGDGIPNRYDRNDRRDGRGNANGHDRDRDGIPDWQDRNDNRGGRR